MATNSDLLIVDDDPEIRSLLRTYLAQNGHGLLTAADGQQMWTQLQQYPVRLVILDLMLPGEDGLSLCRKLRAQHPEMAIIMLTARGEEVDRILGLEMGADDYLPKPFNPRELLARIHAVLRRQPEPTHEPDTQLLRFADWRLDTLRRHLIDPEGVIVSLSGAEYQLLRLLLDHPQAVLSRDRIMDHLKGRDALPYDRSIDIQISRLRRRLRDDGKHPRLIKTVRAAGYVLATAVEREPAP